MIKMPWQHEPVVLLVMSMIKDFTNVVFRTFLNCVIIQVATFYSLVIEKIKKTNKNSV